MFTSSCCARQAQIGGSGTFSSQSFDVNNSCSTSGCASQSSRLDLLFASIREFFVIVDARDEAKLFES